MRHSARIARGLAVLEARPDYWGQGPHLDRLEFVDLGEDPAEALEALVLRFAPQGVLPEKQARH